MQDFILIFFILASADIRYLKKYRSFAKTWYKKAVLSEVEGRLFVVPSLLHIISQGKASLELEGA
jgi:hypothetical protein